MDKQRQQAYYQLIQSLLSCSSGEAAAILQGNQELLDAGFLQTVEAAVEYYSQYGNENEASLLRNLANELGAKLNPPRTILDLDTDEQFLLEVLQTTADSKGDAQVLYPLLAANTDKLNDNFAEMLHCWATNRLAEAEIAAAISEVIFCFSNLIQQFPLGDKASNIEIAITGYEIALTVFTCVDFPQEWAIIQHNLGEVYRNRIRGNKAENIEQAITAFLAALQIHTRADYPQEWAATQNNLGAAYTERIRGDRAENLERAIAAFAAAMEIRTRTDSPQEWAAGQNNLGEAYRNRIRGDRAENLERAIAAFAAAMEIRTRTDFPQEWAAGQNNLGAAYINRIKGDKAENLERAIAAFSAALQIFTRADFPRNWALTHNNLGNAYTNRIRGDKAENLEMAIVAYTAALQIFTVTDFSQNWAMTQNNLGNAYRERIRGDKAENIEMAIATYTTALQVYTRADFPQNWAMTQNNLGNLYRERIRGDKAENIEMAIAAYTAALQIRTRSDFPQDNIGTLYALGFAYQDAQQFNLAYTTFADAIAGVEGLREEIVSGDETKRKQAEVWNRIYLKLVEVCLQLGNITTAIEYVERSKTRSLVESILNRDLKTIFPSEVVTQLEQLQAEITSGQSQIQNGQTENPKALAQHLQQLRQQRNELQDKYLPIGSSFKFDSFQSTLDANTVIIEWYISYEKIIVFIIKSKGQEITVWQSQPEDKEALANWGGEYIGNYYRQKRQWQYQLEERLKKLSEILHLDEILTHVPKHCDKLILIPHCSLHILPLHALPVKESYLLDLFPKGVGYAPSCQLLQQVQLRQRTNFQSLFAIQTPTEDLYDKDLGAVGAIKKQFTNTSILKKEKAQKSAVLQDENLLKANCLFCFCHGYFELNSPLDSGLKLADTTLTLAEIITNLKLENCRLVTLAACETGLTDFTSSSDEYIGLTNGFLLAGSNNVVSSLWKVDTVATALLMIKFYEELQQQSNIVVALITAQRWLRETTARGFQDWLETSALTLSVQAKINNYCAQQDANTKPFASPYYWSAFCAIGKGE